ncbi:9b6e71ec-2cbb-413a-aad4-ef1dd7b78181 [Sclerotinia trifoliorum]|uniref:9b6e71ec-2cbb-413a-aad4-ef1dd7b78181 n=1 Tax=Sclerotinia trifoliorum TaxID=28548 RepID=A0A8H2ZNZ8_9HELO|nr:9b6e71ec-2cbb-413a-aad4-ef1dd7b78181 [Sclerotinia trifoliorum]
MAPKFSEDEIDDLIYFARIGDNDEFEKLREELCKREGCSTAELLETARDSESGNGVLHMSAANGHHELLSLLIKYLSNPSPQNPQMLKILNTQNGSGNTPLHWAALNGHLECVKSLIENGADPTIQNQKGHDAVYEAELADKTEVVDWVLKEGGEGLEEGIAGDEGAEGGEEDENMVEEGTEVVNVAEGEGKLEDAVKNLGIGEDVKK